MFVSTPPEHFHSCSSIISSPLYAFFILAIERFYFSDGHTSEQGILLAGQSGLAQLAKTQKTYQSSTLTKLGFNTGITIDFGACF